MSKFDRKIKRAQERSESKTEKWEDLMEMRKDCIDSYIKQHTLLIELEKTFIDSINKDNEVKEMCKGLNDSLVEISNKIKANMDRHIFETENKDENGNPIYDYKRGKLDPESEDIIEYWNIANEYMIINNDILGVGTSGYITILDKLRAFTNAIKESDVTMLRKAIDNGQNQIIKTMQGGSNGKRKRTKRK